MHTVIVPTRNRATYLADAIDSALRQTQADLEVIVMDDGSTDDTQPMLGRLRDDRVRVVRHAQSQGVSASRNEAVAEARGRWVAFLDDDDLWAPGWLEAALARAEATDAEIIYGARIIIDGQRRPLRTAFAPKADAVMSTLSQMNAFGGPSSVVARTTLVRDVGGFDTRLSALADWDLWLRAAARGRAAAVPEFLVGYTVHAGNMHVTRARAVIDEFRLMSRLQHERDPDRPILDEAGFVRWVAGDSRAYGRRRQAAMVYADLGLRKRSPRDLRSAAGCVLRRHRAPVAAPPAWSSPDWLARYER